MAGYKTRAVRQGDQYVINGNKMFITNGTVCNFMVAQCITSPDQKKHNSFSLIIVPADAPGVTRNKIRGKMGIRSSDTAEIAFEDVKVPVTNLVGKEGKGFYELMHFFDTTRVMVSAQGLGLSEACLETAVKYCKERTAFGSPLGSYQLTQKKLAEVATERLRPLLDPTGASFFEATTAIAFADFAARGADIAVVEVGLGGRLDATNVVTPLVSVVTHVALDHTDYLGTTLEAIAVEKAGIAKPGVPFVVGETEEALAQLLVTCGRAAGARPVRVPPEARYEGRLSLRGPHQRRNAAVAEAVLAALPAEWRPAGDATAAAFARTRLPGRYDRRGRWLFDVAHNPDGLAALLAALAADPPPGPLHAVVCVLRDKDWRGMLQALAGAVDRLWLTDAPSAPADRTWDLPAAAAVLSVFS